MMVHASTSTTREILQLVRERARYAVCQHDLQRIIFDAVIEVNGDWRSVALDDVKRFLVAATRGFRNARSPT